MNFQKSPDSPLYKYTHITQRVHTRSHSTGSTIVSDLNYILLKLKNSATLSKVKIFAFKSPVPLANSTTHLSTYMIITQTMFPNNNPVPLRSDRENAMCGKTMDAQIYAKINNDMQMW